MPIIDRSQDVPADLKPLYELLDNIAGGDIGEEAVANLLQIWLRNHSPKPERDAFTKQDAYRAWKRQHGVCPYCHQPLIDPRRNHHVESAEQTTVDHLIPCKAGGRADQQPVACHRRCNSRKGTADLIQVSKQTGMTTLELLERMKLEGNAESANEGHVRD